MQKALLAVHPALRDDIGDLVTRRPVPGPRVEQVDPFLFLNHHGPQIYPPNNRGLPFGSHPHRGFETVTFILDGELAHRDTAGHESIITAGGVQWMTAGRGVVHEELSPADFKAKGGPMEILQLWVNLPARLKMTDPRYVGLQQPDIPRLPIDGGELNLIAGTWGEATGPITPLVDIFMSTVRLDRGARFSVSGLTGRNIFLYVVRGEILVGGAPVQAMNLAQFDLTGDEITIEAATDTVLLFGHATPFNEPVVSYGPFVMNTEAEIRQAITDYQTGRLR